MLNFKKNLTLLLLLLSCFKAILFLVDMLQIVAFHKPSQF